MWCPDTPADKPEQGRAQFVAADGSLDFSALAQTGWQPLLITGLLRQLLARHFSSPELIESPDLRSTTWSSDPSQSKLLIESVYRWNPGDGARRPALLIKRNGYQNQKLGINDHQQVDDQGESHYATLWTGSHTIFAIHGSAAALELLATEVQRELTQFAPMIRHELCFHDFRVLNVGEISVLEEYKQNFIVPINVGWAYQETWKLASDALPLQSLQLDIGPRQATDRR